MKLSLCLQRPARCCNAFASIEFYLYRLFIYDLYAQCENLPHRLFRLTHVGASSRPLFSVDIATLLFRLACTAIALAMQADLHFLPIDLRIHPPQSHSTDRHQQCGKGKQPGMPSVNLHCYLPL